MWMLEKRQAMQYEFKNVQDVMGRIVTRVHPLNEELCQAVRSSVSHSEAKKVIFSDVERPNKAIRYLNLNTMMLPLMPENANY